MEENMQRFLFIAVTKGHKPGVYTSWEEANQQVLDYTFPEFHGFNIFEHACSCFKARMSLICAEKGRSGETGRVTPDGGGGKKLAISGGGYPCRPIVSWLPVIPTEELNANFAVVSSMEEWLLKVSLEAEIPCPCFFKVERFVGEQGPFFGFTVVIPGHPFEIELFVNGHFSMVEKAAREDVAYEMLCVLLDVTGKEIRDYNYKKAKLLGDSNNALRARVGQLEESYEKLKASYDSLVRRHVEGERV
ncbi:uncharacterized protein DS421_12g363730 [Arachis hypogaea]|nr:uncharacterized protein DS421_12g363730 [Arachis hypogaea]